MRVRVRHPKCRDQERDVGKHSCCCAGFGSHDVCGKEARQFRVAIREACRGSPILTYALCKPRRGRDGRWVERPWPIDKVASLIVDPNKVLSVRDNCAMVDGRGIPLRDRLGHKVRVPLAATGFREIRELCCQGMPRSVKSRAHRADRAPDLGCDGLILQALVYLQRDDSLLVFRQ
jgi:hypothetical protein